MFQSIKEQFAAFADEEIFLALCERLPQEVPYKECTELYIKIANNPNNYIVYGLYHNNGASDSDHEFIFEKSGKLVLYGMSLLPHYKEKKENFYPVSDDSNSPTATSIQF